MCAERRDRWEGLDPLDWGRWTSLGRPLLMHFICNVLDCIPSQVWLFRIELVYIRNSLKHIQYGISETVWPRRYTTDCGGRAILKSQNFQPCDDAPEKSQRWQIDCFNTFELGVNNYNGHQTPSLWFDGILNEVDWNMMGGGNNNRC